MRRLAAIALVLLATGCLRTRFDRCVERAADCNFLDGGPSGDAPTDGLAADAPPADAPPDDAPPTDAPADDAPPDAAPASDAP